MESNMSAGERTDEWEQDSLQILSICQIPKSCSIKIPIPIPYPTNTSHLPHIRGILPNALQLISPVVLPPHQEPERTNKHNLHKMTYDHTPYSQRIIWTLVRLVKEGASNISSTITKEQHSVRDNFLGMPRCVCGLEREDEDESCVVGPCKKVTDIAANPMRLSDEVKPKRAGDVGTEENQDEGAAAVFETVV